MQEPPELPPPTDAAGEAEAPQEPAPRPEPVPWRWWEAFGVFFANLVTAYIVGGIVAGAFRGDLGKSLSVIAFEITLGFWSIFWIRLRHNEPPRRLGLVFDRLRQDIGQGLVWGILGWAFATLVIGNIVVRLVDALSRKPVEPPDQLALENPSALVLTITGIGVILLAPIAEELFFRGFVYQALRRRFAVALAATVSGLLFMLAHAPYWIIFPSIGALGIVLAVLFERRASLVPPIVAHMLFNAIGFAAYMASL